MLSTAATLRQTFSEGRTVLALQVDVVESQHVVDKVEPQQREHGLQCLLK